MLPLPHWTALASLDDEAVPLMSTALLIARDEYPQLDAELYDTLVQSHVEHLRPEVEAIDLWPLKMAAVNRYRTDKVNDRHIKEVNAAKASSLSTTEGVSTGGGGGPR